jgi:hypothetical protein
MSESEETKWRLGAEPEEAVEKAAELSAEEDEKKEELQQSIQPNAEGIGRRGEGSLIARPQEVPITEARKKKQRIAKAEHPTVKIKPDSSKSMVKISNQLEGQAARLARIEKIVLPLQKSVNRINKQSNAIMQLYAVVTQLQMQIRSTKDQKQNQGIQKRKRRKNPVSQSKKRSLKG